MQPSTVGIRLPGITGNLLELTLAGKALSSKYFDPDQNVLGIVQNNFRPIERVLENKLSLLDQSGF